MNLSRKQIVIVAAVVIAVVVLGLLFILSLRKPNASQNITLTIWGTDPAKTMNDVIAPYVSGNSGNKITYTQINPADYKNKVLTALAAGTGPDIIEIGNHDLSQWQNLLAPIPTTTFNLVTLQNDFPTVVGQDFVSGGAVYGLPLAVDTLAMIYNKDLLDSAGIAVPPKTWDDFQKDISSLRSVTPQGQITRAAAAIGGSSASIESASDLLFLLMLQTGTQMTSADLSSATFATNGGDGAPGLSAFNFYLQFANPASPYYTWNDGMGSARQSFAQGKTAILFDYASALTDIKAKAPFLNVAIAPIPQATGASVAVNYAKYNGFAATRSGNVASAWNFIISLALTETNQTVYAKDVSASPSLRGLIQNEIGDPTLAVFAQQALTARSWHEADAAKTDAIMSAAIQSVLNGSANSTRALAQAQSAVSVLMQKQ